MTYKWFESYLSEGNQINNRTLGEENYDGSSSGFGSDPYSFFVVHKRLG